MRDENGKLEWGKRRIKSYQAGRISIVNESRNCLALFRLFECKVFVPTLEIVNGNDNEVVITPAIKRPCSGIELLTIQGCGDNRTNEFD